MRRQFSEKQYKRMRKRRARALRKMQLVACDVPTDDWTNAARHRLVNKPNPSEDHIDSLLRQCQCTYYRERPIRIGASRFFIDFLVVSTWPHRKKVRVAIEVDGGYHSTPEQYAKDCERERLLLTTSRVWSIVRITDKLALSMSAEDLRKAIDRAPLGSVMRLGKHA